MLQIEITYLLTISTVNTTYNELEFCIKSRKKHLNFLERLVLEVRRIDSDIKPKKALIN